ncbi:MAG TPA: SCO family protein [Polyangiaceae bacterium]|nr:SCO family protein [Polyangiaceae bacterium]
MLRTVEWLQRFIASWRFPAFLVSLLLAFDALLLVVLAVPPPRGMEAFAEEFRTWCFGYDARTHSLELSYVVTMLGEPFGIAAIIALVWWKPLKSALRERPAAPVPYVLSAVALVAAGLVAFFAMRSEARADDEVAFPGKSIRTSVEAPAVALTDHTGEAFRLDQERGRVVIVTGVYSSCGLTCPMIMGQAKRAVAALSPAERRDVVVAAITLDPEHDDRARLDAMARAQSLPWPTFKLLWGSPGEVNSALDAFSVARTRDPATGQIDHANLFVLVDRHGKLAYHLTLGREQERWLVDALHELLREP